ncbi:MAG: tRNA (guanosine(46)-N7)-methyltransferase TrmB [Gammaproteobacteria bacterium]|nr:MAG: tRNA (guanosine(46)-N7)-methyltransferase TrmB [Gammaproteobacteria bacterium]
MNKPTPAAEAARLTNRSIRSFVVRNGRLTAAQERAIDTLAGHWCLPYTETTIAPQAVFGRTAPLWLEVGFGNADNLLALASRHPDTDFIGVEVHAPGIGQALLGIQEQGLANLRLIQHDAVEVLETMLPEGSLERLLLLFPDPWHKKRHHKRRIVQEDFIRAACRCLASGASLHAATDWPDYAAWMREHLDSVPELQFIGELDPQTDPRIERTETRFERRGQRLGHPVADLLYQRR